MKLSIIIPSYCAQDNITFALNSIQLQIENDIEVVVVDCSPHDMVKEVCDCYPFVNFIKVKDRFNPGEGRNIGASHSSGEYLVFMDSDVVLANDALNNIKRHTEVGIDVFGASLELNKEVNNTFSAYVEHYYFNHEAQASRKPGFRKNLSSAFMVINNKLFKEFGGFSDIPRMQDTELTERMSNNGINLHFKPDVIGFQIQDSPIRKVLNKILITGNNLFYIRYKNKISNRFLKCLLFISLPLLMFAKISRINIRNTRYSFSFKMLFVYVPFMYVCGLYWMLGFYKALISDAGIESGR